MAIWNRKNFLGVIRHLKAVKLEEQRKTGSTKWRGKEESHGHPRRKGTAVVGSEVRGGRVRFGVFSFGNRSVLSSCVS